MPPAPSAGEQDRNVGDGTLRRFRSRLARRWWLILVCLGLTAGAGVAARPHLRAWYHRRAARVESQRCHTNQAIAHLLICRAIWPRDPETLLLAARAARRAQFYGDAARLLHIYREVRGRDAAYTFEQLLLAAESRVDEVTETCWKGIEEERFDAPLLMEALARGYLRQYRLGQARFCLNRWKEIQPNNAQVFYFEGCLNLDYLHVFSDAILSYRRAVELDSEHQEARLGLAVALLMANNYAEAAQHFQRLIQLQPDNVRVQVGLAECLDNLGQSDEAAQLVSDVLAQQPRLPAALSLQGQLAFKSGLWTDAETALRQSLQANPIDHRARYSLALCLERMGREEEARQQRSQLQQLEEDTARFHEIVTKELAQRPTDPALHCTLGQLLLRSGQHEEGIRWLQNALHLDPHYAPAQKALAAYQDQAKGKSQPVLPNGNLPP